MASPHPNAALITSFYEAFAKRDAEAMANAYADDVHFSDPVFTDLRGDQARDMWRMLTGRSTDLALSFRDVHADDARGSAHWEATYTFSATGRRVHNVIDATFTFRDGKIATHTDRFDLWSWSGMALGAPGKLFGWTPMMKSALRRKAMKGLAAFQAQRAKG